MKIALRAAVRVITDITKHNKANARRLGTSCSCRNNWRDIWCGRSILRWCLELTSMGLTISACLEVRSACVTIADSSFICKFLFVAGNVNGTWNPLNGYQIITIFVYIDSWWLSLLDCGVGPEFVCLSTLSHAILFTSRPCPRRCCLRRRFGWMLFVDLRARCWAPRP